MHQGIPHTVENLGKTDPQYGGTIADVNTLPIGTKFHVRNGLWDGLIIEKDGTKAVEVTEFDTGTRRGTRVLVPGKPEILAIDIVGRTVPRMSLAEALKKNLVVLQDVWDHDDGAEYYFDAPVEILGGRYPKASKAELHMAVGEDMSIEHAILMVSPVETHGSDEECVDVLDISELDPDVDDAVLQMLIDIARKEDTK